MPSTGKKTEYIAKLFSLSSLSTGKSIYPISIVPNGPVKTATVFLTPSIYKCVLIFCVSEKEKRGNINGKRKEIFGRKEGRGIGRGGGWDET
jgi:hypothetical protein